MTDSERSDALDGGTGSGTVPERVAAAYYRYGLLVSKHPFKTIIVALLTFLAFSKPLYYLPLPGYLPQEYDSSVFNYTVPSPAPEGGISLNPSAVPTPLWYQGPPVAYIQQIVVKSAVTPWQEGLSVSDSYRGPLSLVFQLAQAISDFKLKHNHSTSFGSECLLVEGVIKRHESAEPLLPHYNCLLLSPADLWGRNLYTFLEDPHVLLTIHSLMGNTEGKTNVADILFGVPWKEAGFHPNLNQPHRVLTYAITLALKKYNEEFVAHLREELTSRYPLNQPVTHSKSDEIAHVFFPSQLSLWEVLLSIFYCILFASIYFSILKMDNIKNKFVMAIAVQSTILVSLLLTVGISAFFGLRPLHSRMKNVYPVVAALIGGENSMVLIRSVLSTPVYLDSKLRIAQALACEGWTITKYFLTMFTLVTVSFFLFIPIVQEMCIYGSMLLLSDLYMQLVFMTAVLSIDLQRYEDDQQRRRPPRLIRTIGSFKYSSLRPHSKFLSEDSSGSGTGMTSVPNLHHRHMMSKSNGEDILAPPQAKPQNTKEMPRRLKVTYFVASRRLFQRLFICIFVSWIVWMIYTSGLVDHIWGPLDPGPPRDLPSVIFSLTNQSSFLSSVFKEAKKEDATPTAIFPSLHINDSKDFSMNLSRKALTNPLEEKLLRHRSHSLTRHLPHSHWPTLFNYYNITLRGHYLSILPSIFISVPISLEDAKSVHQPKDPNNAPWVQHSSASEQSDAWAGDDGGLEEGLAIIPSSRIEVTVTCILVIPAVVFIVYVTVACYRCICTKNYAEWRTSSWWQSDRNNDETAQIIGDALPFVLNGHSQEVECVCSDGVVVVSSCLAGTICVWDPHTGECISTIERNKSRPTCSDAESKFVDCDEQHSDYESGSPRSLPDFAFFHKPGNADSSVVSDINAMLHESDNESDLGNNNSLSLHSYISSKDSRSSLFNGFPDLSSSINVNFSGQCMCNSSCNGVCFGGKADVSSRLNHIEHVYQEYQKQLSEEQKHYTKNCKRCSLGSSDSTDKLVKYVRSRSSADDLSSRHAVHSVSGCRRQARHSRNLSAGSIPFEALVHSGMPNPIFCTNRNILNVWPNHVRTRNSPVWCLECSDMFVFIGCSSGRIEIWDAQDGSLKVAYEDGCTSGITSLRAHGRHLFAARLCGAVDFLKIKFSNEQDSTTYSYCHARGHIRNSSSGSLPVVNWSLGDESDLLIRKYATIRAHQQPISVLTCDRDRLVTASHDHTLKVFNMSDASILFTLHGHCGPITTALLATDTVFSGPDADMRTYGVAIDLSVGPVIASGGQDGSLCVWDLYSGACVYSVQAHDGSVLNLSYTSSYLLSLGTDERLCVWERFQGLLTNTIHIKHAYCSSMVMLTNRLLITSSKGSLTVWDVTSGSAVRIVRLGDKDHSVFVRHLLLVDGSIVCNYGNQLRVVRLPVAEKTE